MIPNNRQEFIDYCVRALGGGITQVNVTPQHLSDRVDQALYMYQQYHMDAVEQQYLAHPITPSQMVFTANTSGTFSTGESIVGSVSNTHGIVVGTANASSIYFYTLKSATGTGFVPGDVIVGNSTGASGTIAPQTAATLVFANTVSFATGETILAANSNAQGQVLSAVNSTAITYTLLRGTFVANDSVTGLLSNTTGTLASVIIATPTVIEGDADRKYFTVPPDVLQVRRVLPPFDSRMSADILFDPQSQFNMSLLANFTSNSIIPYVIGRQYQQLINDTFRGRPGHRFQRHNNRVYVDVNWTANFVLTQNLFPHSYVIVDCDRIISPDEFPLIWSDRWLQQYTIALIKKQWGTNLKKYNGIALPGGVTLDGKTIYDEAVQEIKDLEDELRDKYQEPPMFIVG